jgi:hypothetical protein
LQKALGLDLDQLEDRMGREEIGSEELVRLLGELQESRQRAEGMRDE